MPSDATVVNESAQYTSRVTQYPIEDGSNINDHLIKDPEKFSIDGEIVGGMQTASLLTAMRDNRDILSYTGRMYMDSLVITSLSLKASAKNEYGVNFQAQLQRVQITTAQYASLANNLANAFPGRSEGLTQSALISSRLLFMGGAFTELLLLTERLLQQVRKTNDFMPETIQLSSRYAKLLLGEE